MYVPRLRVVVPDDDTGFALGRARENGHGVLTMRDLLGAIGGSWAIESVPDSEAMGEWAMVSGSVRATPIGAGE